MLFSVFMSGCVRQNHINFSSSEAFFSSLNKTDMFQKENKNNTFTLNNLQKKKTDKQITTKTFSLNNLKKKKADEQIKTKAFSLTLASYEKQLKQKISFDEFTILKIFNNPNLKIKHGKIKNFQFHLKSCHLDLFFLDKDKTYIFKHFDIRPSAILSNLDKKKCVEELNNKFTLIRDPK